MVAHAVTGGSLWHSPGSSRRFETIAGRPAVPSCRVRPAVDFQCQGRPAFPRSLDPHALF